VGLPHFNGGTIEISQKNHFEESTQKRIEKENSQNEIRNFGTFEATTEGVSVPDTGV